MHPLLQDIEKLPPEKRALLELLLAEQGISLTGMVGAKDQKRTTIGRRPAEMAEIPLSFAQRRLWFLHQLEPGSPTYNISSAVRLLGRLRVPVLQRVLDAIVRRHEILRTTFPVKGNGEPVQVVAREASLPLRIVDLQDLPTERREHEARRLAAEDAQRPFDLEAGPLVRVHLLRLADDDHVLLVTMHHIVADGWSVGVFIQETAALYQAFTQGKPSPLPDLPIQYGDFTLWQLQYLGSPEDERSLLRQQLNFWQRQLADMPAMLELPADRPRPRVQTYHGDHINFEVPPALYEGLRQLAHQADATLFMTLLAAFQTLLYRLTGQADIGVGTPVANRHRAELEPLIGFFVNTLVLRSDLSGNPSFVELLGRVKQVALDAFANQDVPFEQVVDAVSGSQRDMSRTPLFQVLFVLQHAPQARLTLPDISLDRLDVDSPTVKFDLTLTVNEAPDRLLCTWGYNTDLFDRSTVERITGHFLTLLTAIAADPRQAIDRLPLLSPQEEHLLLDEWSRSTTAPGDLRAVHQLFEAQAAATPDAIAIEVPDAEGRQVVEQITYGELSRRSNQVARHLTNLGIGPESLVAISVSRSIHMVVGLLGILKAGAAYLPIDPNYPAERIAFMLRDSGAQVLLTQQPIWNKAMQDIVTHDAMYQQGMGDEDATPGARRESVKGETIAQTARDTRPTLRHIVLLDTDWPAIAQLPPTYRSADLPAPDALAYVIYTSGSTGNPKGVLVPHKALANYVVYAAQRFGLEPRDRLLQFSSLSFDAAAEEIYPTLLTGATLVLRNDAMLSSVPTFLRSCAALGLTVLDLPTAYWHQVVATLEEERLPLPGQLRLVICGGERAVPERVRAWQRLAGHIRLLNTYGPTEATIVATDWELPTDRELVLAREVPIGRPIANVTAYILDRCLQPVPIGVPGELYLGGACVARGYLNRPELTAERFVPDPYHPISPSPRLPTSGARLYRTGDLVRWLPDGNIEYLGRVDEQVKIRGFRIELGEIEAALRRHPTIRDAVVTAREDRPGDRRLVAYFTTNGSGVPTVSGLQSFLRHQLPDYMVPSQFMHLDALPTTASGKVNRRALPKPDQGRPDLGREFVAPRTPLEKHLAELWQELLGVTRVGVHDNFFELGGDSLKAAVLINRLQQQVGQVIWVAALFDAPTVGELARYLVENYPGAVAPWGGDQVAPLPAEVTRRQIHVTPEKVAEMQRAIAARTPEPARERAFLSTITHKNPPAVFILSAPRSGSTLLRVMLAGHPRLFSPPELALLSYQTLQERLAAFTGRNAGWLEGVLRAIMEIKGCDLDEARRIMHFYESRNLPTFQFYGLLQEWIGDRTLVDKTTTYARDPVVLQRAEAYFENARYIHLVRHPAAMIQSYLSSKLDQVFGYGFPFSPREKAELFWLISNQNVRQFFQQIPAQRRYFLRFEDLVQRPREILEDICRFLDIEFVPAMLEPYQGRRMTDGVHPESRMVGDPGFLERRSIDSSEAFKWQQMPAGDALARETLDLALAMGYEIAPEADGQMLAPSPVPRTAELPLSFAQQRLWFLDQLDPGNPAYNIPLAVRLKGRLDVDALRGALNEIVARHEVLRTAFPSVRGEAHQVIATQWSLPLSVEDLSYLPRNEQEARVQRLAAEEARRPFDLSKGPLFRIRLLKLGGEPPANDGHSANQEHVVLLTLHHIIYDGWSGTVFVRELAALYAALVQSRPSPLPPLPLQYADYAAWQRQALQGETLERQLRYWRQKLSGAPPLLELPTDRPRPPLQTSNGAHLTFTLSHDLTARLKALGQGEGATLFMTLLSAFQTLLSRYTHQDDICVGTPVAGRNRRELEGLIGLFVNTLVLRSDLSGKLSFRELLRQVRRTCLEAFAHQDLPFEMLVDELHPTRDLSHSPLFQVMFVFQNLPGQRVELPGVLLEEVAFDTHSAKFDLTLIVNETPSALAATFEYNTDLFDRATIQRMAGHFQTLLEGIVADPDRPVDFLPLLTDAEQHTLLAEWCANPAPFDTDDTLHHRFSQQARRTPDAVAVMAPRRGGMGEMGEMRETGEMREMGEPSASEFRRVPPSSHEEPTAPRTPSSSELLPVPPSSHELDELSYAELERRSNQLAQHLAALGVQPGHIVGLMTERSTDTLVGLFGILKAGAAYLPLDPTYPADRIAFMLCDSAAQAVVAHAHVWLRFAGSDDFSRPVTTEVVTTKHDAPLRSDDFSRPPLGSDDFSRPPLGSDDFSRPETAEAVTTKPQPRIKAVLLDRDWPAIARQPDALPAVAVPPDAPAYVIYTSGSTGRPKGAVISHRNALNLAAALDQIVTAEVVTTKKDDAPLGSDDFSRPSPLGSDDFSRPVTTEVVTTKRGRRPLRVSLNAPLAFDASVQQWSMLLYGHTLVVIPDDLRGDADALLAFIRRHHLDQLDCVPSQLKLLLDAGLLDPDAPWTPAILFPGGEAIDPATWQAIANAPATAFFNMYGPTECTVDSTTALASAHPGRPVIGRPLANVRTYVLDRYLQPVPIGVPGELCIAGAGVGLGYLNRPDLTAEKFVPDPFVNHESANQRITNQQTANHQFEIQDSRFEIRHSPFANSRLYRTGDLVRWLPDGHIEFLGRTDFQVKVRGFRIELGEIEAALMRHPAVKEAVVLARADRSGDKRLVAYVVPATTEAVTTRELRHHLLAELPEYMVPSAFVLMPALPLTPNRKVDRKALPAPEEAERAELGTDYVPPATPTERILADIWAQVLGVERIGAHDNFFELGGDSILSIQVVARANQAGLRLTPRQLFQAPTVAGLAALAQEAGAPLAEQGPVTGPVPLTPVQRWFFALDLPNRNHWNQTLLFATREPLEPAALRQAVAALLAHHDALRLRFAETDAGWTAVNADFDPAEAEAVFSYHDLSALPDDEASAQVEALAAAAQRSLDIVHGPLLRVVYCDLGLARPGRLLITVHHLAVDGVSWRILLEDLQTAYQQARNKPGAQIQLPTKTTSFRTWAQRLAEYARSAAVQADLNAWLALGEDWLPSLPLETDADLSANTEASVDQVSVVLTAEETRALLQDVPPVYRTEINDILLTALAQTITAWADADKLYVLLEGHGREELGTDEGNPDAAIDVSRTVGWFTTLYPVRLSLPKQGGPGEAIMAVKEQLRAVPQRGLSFGLLRYLSPDPDVVAALASLPLPEIAFNYLGQLDQTLGPDTPFAPARESAGPDRAPDGRRSHLFTVTAGVAHGQLNIGWSYSRALHRRTTVERLTHDFADALRHLIAHCLTPEAGGLTPSDFDLASLDHRQLDKVLRKIQPRPVQSGRLGQSGDR